jgi:hypothetical protein
MEMIMIVRRTVSILDWNDDGSCASTIWVVSFDEREDVALLLSHRDAVHGLITPDQSDGAFRATRSWLTTR